MFIKKPNNEELPILPLVKAQTLAELLNVKTATIYKWVERGQIPVYRLSDKCDRFDVVEIFRQKRIDKMC